MPDLTSFNLADITGVGVAAFAVYLFYKISSNHIAHNTSAITELKEVIKELTHFLKEHHK